MAHATAVCTVLLVSMLGATAWAEDWPYFFFFKQKTAYEIETDWSSDVCSSDLESLFPNGYRDFQMAQPTNGPRAKPAPSVMSAQVNHDNVCARGISEYPLSLRALISLT